MGNFVKVYVDGMKCKNCAGHVKDALMSVDGITDAEVNLSDKYALVKLDKEVNDEVIKQAVNTEKYNVVGIEKV